MRILFYIALCISANYSFGQDLIRSFKPEGKIILSFELTENHIVLNTDNEKYYSFNGLDFTSSILDSSQEASILRHFRYSVQHGILNIYSPSFSRLELQGISVRTIQKDFIGTYNGVWLNGKKLKTPFYSSGRAFSYNDTSFICYDGVVRIIGDDTTTFVNKFNGLFKFKDKSFSNARDIRKLGQYLIQINAEEVLLFDSKYESILDSVPTNRNEANRFIRWKNQAFKNSLSAIIGNNVSTLYIDTINEAPRLRVHNMLEFKETIRDHYIFSDNSKDVVVSERNTYISKGAPFNSHYDTIQGNYHGAFNYRDKIFLISDKGLFRMDNNKTVQLRNVEFNRGSVFIDGDTVKIGSVEGVFTYSLPALAYEDPFIDTESVSGQSATLRFFDNEFTFIVSALSLAILTVTLLVFIFLRAKSRSTKKVSIVSAYSAPGLQNEMNNQKDKKSLNDQILDYIDQNLPTVSNKDIMFEFNLTQIKLYSLFDDTTPGKIIGQKRKNLTRKLLKQNLSIDEIIEQTGYSESYLIQTIIPEIESEKSRNI